MRRIRLSTVLALCAAAGSGTILFWSSQQVQTSDRTLRHLREFVATEKRTIRVLSAEWDYLNRPDRLEALATQYLHMTAPSVKQMVGSAEHLPDMPVATVREEKPAIVSQPAALTTKQHPAPAATAAASSPDPSVDASSDAVSTSPQENRSFQTLLNDLGDDKGQ